VINLRKEEDFSEWYNEIVELAGITDKRYPVKGMNVWTPYGWKAMLLIDAVVRREFNRRGNSEVCFPLFIPEDQFSKEKEHVKGFDEQVYWVTHAGRNELDIRLVVRPTSETAMYPIFSLWVRSHADLPLKIYQIVNVFRYETKQTRALMRMREIHFIEGHTCHASFEDAERQISEDLQMMKAIAQALCIPYSIHRRPEWDKFPGAYYSLGIDTIMPDGRTLQIGTIHQYRTNFSVPYNIGYENEEGRREYVHQTTYGMSERLLGALISIHGDERGLIFPPEVAPIQAIIVIIAGGDDHGLAGYLSEVREVMTAAGIRFEVDDRDIRPGNKYYEWERKGVPLRLEIGQREMREREITLCRRDTGKRIAVRFEALAGTLVEMFDGIAQNLHDRASRFHGSMIHIVAGPEHLTTGVNRMWWCGEEKCGIRIEEISGASVLGTQEDSSTDGEGKCTICGRTTTLMVSVARSM